MTKEIPIRQSERRVQRIGNIVEQRRVLFDRIGTGEVRLDTGLEPEAYLDTALKIGRTKERVATHIETLEQRQSNLRQQIRDARIRELEGLVERGMLDASVFEPLKQFIPEPRPKPVEQTIVEAPRAPLPTEEAIEVRLPDGKRVEDIYSEDLAKLFEKLSAGPTLNEDLQGFIFNEVNDENRIKVRHLVDRARRRLRSQQLDWEIRNVLTTKSSIYSLGKPGEVPVAQVPNIRTIETTGITLPDGNLVSIPTGRREAVLRAITQGHTSIIDLSKLIFGNSNSRERLNVSTLISKLNTILKGQGYTITNLTSPSEIGKGKPARYSLEKIETETKKPQERPEAKEQIYFALPDGQIFSTASENLARIIEALTTGPVSNDDLADHIFEKTNSQTKHKTRNLIARAKIVLEKNGWTIRNLIEVAPGKTGVYKLEEIKTEQAVEEVSKQEIAAIPEETIVPADEIDVNKPSDEFVFSDGAVFTTPRGTTIRVLEALAKGPGNSGDMAERVFGARDNVHKGTVRSEISRIRKILAKTGSSWTIERIETDGMGSYELKNPNLPLTSTPEIPAEISPDEVPAEVDQTKEKPTETRRPHVKESVIPDFYEKKPRQLTLPNGQLFEVDSAWSYYLTQYIADGANSIGEVAERVFGNDTKKNRGRVSAAVAGANRAIRKSGFLFENMTSASERNMGVQSRYEWAKIDAGEVITPASAIEQPIPRSLGNVEIVPYEPSPEEIRTEEETRVISAILDELDKSQKIYFDNLQRTLRTDVRIEVRGGRRMYRLYDPDEIKSLFESGLRKLREESQATKLMENWTPNDQRIWNAVNSGNFDEYLRKIKKLIDQATKDFYGPGRRIVQWIELPPQNGGTLYESR